MGLGPDPGDLRMTSAGGVRTELRDSQLVLENGQCGHKTTYRWPDVKHSGRRASEERRHRTQPTQPTKLYFKKGRDCQVG